MHDQDALFFTFSLGSSNFPMPHEFSTIFESRADLAEASGRTSKLPISGSGLHPFRDFGIGLVGQFYPPAGDQHKPCSLLDVGLLRHLKAFGGITTEGFGICRHEAHPFAR
jgi:hypothetical protein